MTGPLWTPEDIQVHGDALVEEALASVADVNDECDPVWIGAAWRCETHDRYIEDGNVCPEADPVWDGLP